MAKLPKAVSGLIEVFQSLPGIGPKTAARLTFYLLRLPEEKLQVFATALLSLKKETVICQTCFNIAEENPCAICTDLTRDRQVLCVVENAIEVLAIETTGYRGLYHVLGGAIDPLNNIGPDQIRIKELFERLVKANFAEVIIATNPSMEGEATAMYIKNQLVLKQKNEPQLAKLKISRLAYGLPIGADVEFADSLTLTKALEGRREY